MRRHKQDRHTTQVHGKTHTVFLSCPLWLRVICVVTSVSSVLPHTQICIQFTCHPRTHTDSLSNSTGPWVKSLFLCHPLLLFPITLSSSSLISPFSYDDSSPLSFLTGMCFLQLSRRLRLHVSVRTAALQEVTCSRFELVCLRCQYQEFSNGSLESGLKTTQPVIKVRAPTSQMISSVSAGDAVT